VPHHYQRRTGDEDELQGPQADVGDGEDVVVAHVDAARLDRVTHKVLVLVAPHPLRRHHEHHHPEDEDYREPHAAEPGGVLVDPTDEGLQSRPVHDGCLRGRGLGRRRLRELPQEARWDWWDEVLDDLNLS